MSSERQLINDLRSNNLNNYDNIALFYVGLCDVSDYIYQSIPNDNKQLVVRFETERQCVYNELTTNFTGENDKTVINSCIAVLNDIITYLQSKPNDEFSQPSKRMRH